MVIKSPKAASAGRVPDARAAAQHRPGAGRRPAAASASSTRASCAARDPFVLYQALCAATGKRQDPCVLDTFMAATDFMRGADAAPWWHYTAQRKALYGSV